MVAVLGVPSSGRCTMDALYRPDVGDAYAPVLGSQTAADRHLGQGDAIIAPRPSQAWIPRFLLACLHPAKERLKGAVKTHNDSLQDLRLHASQRRPTGLECRQCRLLVIEPYRLLMLVPGGAARSQQMVVQPAALLQLSIEEALLFDGRVEAVFGRLLHELFFT